MEPCVVNTRPTGEMDISDFRKKLIANKERGLFTAIVNVNCGTTVKVNVEG